MSRRRFALLFGILLLLLGIAGFVPPLMWDMHPEYPPLTLDVGAGRLLGLFPVNLLQSIIHIALGLWGIGAARRVAWATFYARVTAAVFFVLMMAGFLPGLLNGFGLLPLYGNDIWLHALLTLIAAYFGWLHRDYVPTIVVDDPI